MSSDPAQTQAIYETERLLAEYLLFHYGKEDEILPPGGNWPQGMREALGFPIRTVRHFSAAPAELGLDLGCAVGRSSWEMARTCKSVVGIDFSHSFIQTANSLRCGETVPYSRLDEAHRVTTLEAKPPDAIDASRLAFEQGDAMRLRTGLKGFDRVHAANLLCRLSDPLLLLERLPSLVAPLGELVLATPCTWLKEFTPADRWPEPDTLSWLEHHLSPWFDLTHVCEEPFLIRETARKFQWSRSLVSMWRRKA